ncbi:MAG: response regulator [Elusimicrobia bacterium]|nr:response regulator [Elusimicrobiota bacterium]MDA8244311.1 response regulator [Elusimicrobiota bacterium]
MKILVVDDNLLTRSMIKDLLSEMGHEIVGEAENGDEAVRLFKELRPELTLLDMIMPGKSGLETLQEIKASDQAAKVVMVTAVQQESLSSQLLSSGAAAVLHKPFMYGDLEEVLKTL